MFNSSTDPVAVYIHVPFCPSKCGYCDFNSYAMDGEIIERTIRAIEQDIRQSPHVGRPAKTIFFGGGTPTFLSADQLCGLLRAVLETHPPDGDIEITSEGNPGTVDMQKFEAMRKAGFNRLSLGAQSFQVGDLMRLGRVHAPGHIGKAVQSARAAGFENLNLDLMFALPGQSLTAWRTNLELALMLQPDHLSLYCLTIEQNTRFYRHNLRGLLNLPEDDSQIAMYEAAIEMTRDAGMEQYEISNFSKPGLPCAHNLCYWHAEEYLAYGPGAVGRIGSRRFTRLKHPVGYSEAVEKGLPLDCIEEELDDAMLRFERLMLGLRLNQGVEMDAVEVDPIGLRRMLEREWVSASDRLALTPAGRHFCNEVITELAAV